MSTLTFIISPLAVFGFLCGATAADFTPTERAEHEKTIRIYSSSVIPSHPQDARAYTIRGFAYFSLGQNELALADYSQAVVLAPTFSDHYRRRAEVYTALGDNEKALGDLSQAIRLSPQRCETYVDRADVYWRRQEYLLSQSDYERAVALAPNNAAACHGLAWFYLNCPDEKLRDGKKALQFAQRAFDLSGGKVPTYVETLRGARENQAKRAVDEFKSLEELISKGRK